MVSGAVSSKTGSFKLTSTASGNFILKVSYIGYNPSFRTVSLTKEKPTSALGNIELSTNDIALKMAQITAKVAKVEMKEDTFVYNAAAYRVPEGSTLEALIEKLPGVEVADDGTIKANGKTVTQIMLDGKDFFKGDTKVAMKNLPVSLVEKVKAYEKQSEYTKQTGIDDGEEETVLDLSLKKKLKSSWVSNIDLGAGTEDRYTSKLFANRYDDNTRITAFGSMNNVNDRGFMGGGGGFRNGRSGLVANKMFGLDGLWSNGKKEKEAGRIELGGNIRYNHSNSESESTTNSESFLNGSSSSSFSNSKSIGRGRSTNFSGEFRLEWNPDTMTSITFRPEYSHSESNSWSKSQSATFNADPYSIEGIKNPLDEARSEAMKGILVNTNDRESLSDSKSDNVSASLQATRRLNNMGRNVSVNASLGYTNTSNHSFSTSDIYYQAKDSLAKTNQYTNNPQKNWNYRLRLSYAEPLKKNLFLQLRYQFQYRYSDTDRSLYQMADSLAAWGITPQFGTIPVGIDSLQSMIDLRNSQYATYKYFNHDATLGIRYVTDNINLNAGVSFQPQTTKLTYQKDKLDTLVTRNVFNWSPRVNFRYKFSKTSQLNARYRGYASEPSMTNLLDITDDSDPLNITKGNPGLKPSWTNTMNVFYNNYITEKQQGYMVNASFNQTSNSISNAVVYDETTGVRTSRPENINGNWSANGAFMFNTAIGSEKSFNVSTFTNVDYNNSVGYISVNNASSEKNTTKTLGVGENARANYRNDVLEVGVNGSLNYQHSRNELQSTANMDTYRFSYGANVQYTLPWNMSISSDIGMNSRRGYSDNSMNTNELIWNAQISQTFLRGKNATLSIQLYDILKEQSNVSRTINAQMRSDSWSKAINSYCMVHFIYRLNIFGGTSKSGDNEDRDRRREGGRPGRGESRPMTPMMGAGRM